MQITVLVWLMCSASVGVEPYVPCGEVPEQGVCESKTKVIWCEDKQLKSLDCVNGTVCAWNDVILSFDCLEAACDGVPSTGECTDEGTVHWCEDGQTKALVCPGDTTCGWNESMGTFDCIKQENVLPPTQSDTSASDADTHSPPRNSSDTGSIPMPNPPGETLGDVNDTSSGSSGGGCQAARTPRASPILIMIIMLVVLGWIRRFRPQIIDSA